MTEGEDRLKALENRMESLERQLKILMRQGKAASGPKRSSDYRDRLDALDYPENR